MGESKDSATFVLFSQGHGPAEFMCEMESIVNDYQRGDAAHHLTTELRQKPGGLSILCEIVLWHLPEGCSPGSQNFPFWIHYSVMVRGSLAKSVWVCTGSCDLHRAIKMWMLSLFCDCPCFLLF